MKRLLRPSIVIVTVLAALLFMVMATAHGQGTFLGGIVSYVPGYNWVQFTDQTGTWHAPLALHNSAAPSDSVVEFTVNTDDQFVLQAYAGGQPRSLLDVDTDGSAALIGSAGGGIAVEAATGDTCMPTGPTGGGALCSPTALRVAPDGIVKQYLGQATAGYGISTIVYSADATLTGSFGPYTIFTTNNSGPGTPNTLPPYASSGMYRLTGYMTVTGAAPGATMQFVGGYTDESGQKYQNTGLPAPFQNVGDSLPFTFVFYCQGSAPITIATIVAGGNPTYTIHLRLEAM